MDVRSRVHRILKPMRNFVPSNSANGAKLESAGQFGQHLGDYESPNDSQIAIRIFDDGIVWKTADKDVEFRFSDILQLLPIRDLHTEEIVIEVKHKGLLTLPVKGNVGKFNEAQEIYRLLERVVNDTDRAIG
jgi:hypothetical protein